MRNELVCVTSIVTDVLEHNYLARCSDMILYDEVLQRLGLPTDVRQLRKKWDGDIFGTISRARRKVQERFPELKVASVEEERLEKAQEVREFAREN